MIFLISPIFESVSLPLGGARHKPLFNRRKDAIRVNCEKPRRLASTQTICRDHWGQHGCRTGDLNYSMSGRLLT